MNFLEHILEQSLQQCLEHCLEYDHDLCLDHDLGLVFYHQMKLWERDVQLQMEGAHENIRTLQSHGFVTHTIFFNIALCETPPIFHYNTEGNFFPFFIIFLERHQYLPSRSSSRICSSQFNSQSHERWRHECFTTVYCLEACLQECYRLSCILLFAITAVRELKPIDGKHSRTVAPTLAYNHTAQPFSN